MKHANELGMIAAFYLSKYGEHALARLDAPTYKQAFSVISDCLQINPNSVKNWRDEFDPYYDNRRKGWYRRPIRPSRLKVIEALDDLSEDALGALVADILQPQIRPRIESELSAALTDFARADNDHELLARDYVARGPTGRMAEEFFIACFDAGLTQFQGQLQDRRDEGVGYDFEITRDNLQLYVEIKGSAKEQASISFTDKEWRVARKYQDGYFLGLVRAVHVSPRLSVIQNPAMMLNPVYRAYPTVSVSWTVSPEQLIRVGCS